MCDKNKAQIYKYKNHNCLQNRWKLKQKTNTKNRNMWQEQSTNKFTNIRTSTVLNEQQKFKQMNKQTEYVTRTKHKENNKHKK